MLDVVDHEDIDRAFGRFQFQSELFLKGREERYVIRSRRWNVLSTQTRTAWRET